MGVNARHGTVNSNHSNADYFRNHAAINTYTFQHLPDNTFDCGSRCSSNSRSDSSSSKQLFNTIERPMDKYVVLRPINSTKVRSELHHLLNHRETGTSNNSWNVHETAEKTFLVVICSCGIAFLLFFCFRLAMRWMWRRNQQRGHRAEHNQQHLVTGTPVGYGSPQEQLHIQPPFAVPHTPPYHAAHREAYDTTPYYHHHHYQQDQHHRRLQAVSGVSASAAIPCLKRSTHSTSVLQNNLYSHQASTCDSNTTIQANDNNFNNSNVHQPSPDDTGTDAM